MTTVTERPGEPRFIFGKTNRRELWITWPVKKLSLLIREDTCPDNYLCQAHYQIQRFLLDHDADLLTDEEHDEIAAMYFVWWQKGQRSG